MNVKKVDSAPKNGPILMGDSSLEAYGQVVSFWGEFFSPPFCAPSGKQNVPFSSKKVDSAPKNGPIFMGAGSLEAFGQVVSFF